MKKLILIIVAVAISHSIGYPQSCLPEGIIFTNQAQIDSFQINYPGCTEIEGNVDIDGDNIINLSGINVITYIGGDFRIWGNFILTSLSGLENLTHIGGSFWIFYNASLLSLSGVENLVSIGQEFHIGESEFNDGNPNLNSISALENLTSIGGILEISNNPSLTSLTGLENIDVNTITELYIFNNTSLPSCDIQIVCEYLDSPNGSINIYNNALGCNNPVEVANACGITFDCLPYGNYYFVTQDEIDNFQINYSGCFDLEGDVRITGWDEIYNLSGLTVINSIEGNLFIYDTEFLTSLSGLEGLTNIGGTLLIGDYNLGYNWSIINLNGLENLASIGGNLIIDRNLVLESLSGLEGLTSIGQWFFIGYNPSLTSISALSNLNSIGGSFLIGSDYPENNSLTSLTGLENLSFIGGYLRIWGMDSLTNLLALENLNSIDGVFEIVGNDALTSLTGLDNIDAASIDHIIIRNNSSLSSCEVQSICDYLAAPGGAIEIHNNAPGCNSPEEVEKACETVSIGEISFCEELTIHPNPFSTSTTIEYELTKPSTVQLTIYDYLGKQFEVIERAQSHGKQQIIWNAEGLPAGVYFCAIKTNQGIQTTKLIKL